MPTASKVLHINGENTGIASPDVNDTDDAQQLIRISTNLPDEKDGDNSKISPKKKTKRIKRKCSAPNCENKVVQGGVCITHGAKRKLCSHPGCTKTVKAAGFCSTHGPPRKKCESIGCIRVAVQGGKCLSHGARKIGKRDGLPASDCEIKLALGGVFITHGSLSTHVPAQKKCESLGCIRVAVQGGKCLSHGAKRAEEIRERNRLHAQASRLRKKQKNQALVDSVNKLRQEQLCHIQAIADSSTSSQDDIVANAQVQELLLRRKSLNDIPSIAGIHISESEIAIKEAPHYVVPQERERVRAKRYRKMKKIKNRKTEELIEQLESENALLLGHLQGIRWLHSQR